ncbi:MAG TPA: hypothetical protein V6C72_16725 [Chroococcales cyanobacterium]
MSNNDLTVLDATAEDNAVIERFSQASRELVPSLEVRLAKRIIKPGSDRMMCLAAHTTVPLDDDEIASVSNLALRLSDGTNVALSLSFFNDAVYPMQSQANRFYYDPKRYKEDRDSRLGAFLVAATIIASTCFYGYLHNPFGNHSGIPLRAMSLTPWSMPWPAVQMGAPHATKSAGKSLSRVSPANKTQAPGAVRSSSSKAQSDKQATAKLQHESAASEAAIATAKAPGKAKSLSLPLSIPFTVVSSPPSVHAAAHAGKTSALTGTHSASTTHSAGQMLIPPPPPMTPVDLAPFNAIPEWNFKMPVQLTPNPGQTKHQKAQPAPSDQQIQQIQPSQQNKAAGADSAPRNAAPSVSPRSAELAASKSPPAAQPQPSRPAPFDFDTPVVSPSASQPAANEVILSQPLERIKGSWELNPSVAPVPGQ